MRVPDRRESESQSAAFGAMERKVLGLQLGWSGPRRSIERSAGGEGDGLNLNAIERLLRRSVEEINVGFWVVVGVLAFIGFGPGSPMISDWNSLIGDSVEHLGQILNPPGLLVLEMFAMFVVEHGVSFPLNPLLLLSLLHLPLVALPQHFLLFLLLPQRAVVFLHEDGESLLICPVGIVLVVPDFLLLPLQLLVHDLLVVAEDVVHVALLHVVDLAFRVALVPE